MGILLISLLTSCILVEFSRIGARKHTFVVHLCGGISFCWVKSHTMFNGQEVKIYDMDGIMLCFTWAVWWAADTYCIFKTLWTSSWQITMWNPGSRMHLWQERIQNWLLITDVYFYATFALIVLYERTFTHQLLNALYYTRR